MSPRSLVSALDFLTRARGAQHVRRRQKPRGRGSKAVAPLGGERLEPWLALAVNFASGLPADMTASAYLFIGDHSVSNSEIWRMNVAATSLTAPGYGLVLREQGTFARGVSYPITVEWLDSNRAAGPDYDYRAWIDRSANPTWTLGSPTPSSPDFFVTDPGQLLQRRWFGSEVNATLGKTAEVHFPGIDLDVDSDNGDAVCSRNPAIRAKNVTRMAIDGMKFLHAARLSGVPSGMAAAGGSKAPRTQGGSSDGQNLRPRGVWRRRVCRGARPQLRG